MGGICKSFRSSIVKCMMFLKGGGEKGGDGNGVGGGVVGGGVCVIGGGQEKNHQNE